MGLHLSVPVLPGVRYSTSPCSGRRGPRGGLTLLFAVALLLAVSIQFWWVTVPLLGAFGGLVLSGLWNQRRAAQGMPTGPTIRDWLDKHRRTP